MQAEVEEVGAETGEIEARVARHLQQFGGQFEDGPVSSDFRVCRLVLLEKKQSLLLMSS